ncbi:glycosyltransferase family 4 protein [Colwellia demingiae]|uniref:Glycosyltransferase family 4 protein n=1 Tax=Colwellia demingiae TaxID=89401 RepID=A0A5C6Q7D2_9GAMM|nr:glycosyltransferase [Colwellia demingiae]TWX64819.1 glycosyltransferase family 4 protein [Colwellia demingiae]
MKKLLIIGYVWPEPNSSAAGSRMMQLIHFFQSQNYHITFASPAQQTEHMVDLRALNIDVENISLNCTSFDYFIKNLQPTTVMYDRFMMEEQFGWRVSEQCPQALRLLDTEDLFCLRNARHQAYKLKRDITDEDLLTSDMAKREVASIFRSDISLMISSIEVELLQRLFKVDASSIHYCPFMLNQARLTQENPSYQQREDFMAIGNFRHAPNWDAVLWLKQQVWPLIRKQLPSAKLNIYGAYPPPKATDLHDEKSGFLVKGWVDDAVFAMKSAKVCLAPLRFGAGIKGKLAEAMYCSTPSVTTDIGAESMQTNLPWAGAIANDPQAIADAAVKLYQDEQTWQVASDLGQQNATLMYQQDNILTELADCLSKLEANLNQRRQANFIGSMLNHHHHKSTQYMSQWIDVKTQLKVAESQQSEE